MQLTFVLNEQNITLDDAAADKLLLDFLREDMGLTGTKRGCDTGVCGACSVLLGDKLVRSCRTPLSKVAGKTVTTIEGIAGEDGSLSELQQAFLDYGAVQCGFCTPGMIIAGEALLRKNLHPNREEIRKAISGNLCRCTGYQQIVDAIEAAAKQRAAHSEGGTE